MFGSCAPANDAWLVDVTAASGLDFTYRSGASGKLHMPEIMGAGVAFIDYDGDGDLDIYATNGNASPATASRGGDLFPHLYAPLDPACVLRVYPLPLEAEGHRFPVHIEPGGR